MTVDDEASRSEAVLRDAISHLLLGGWQQKGLPSITSSKGDCRRWQSTCHGAHLFVSKQNWHVGGSVNVDS